ncbi:MAG TPA: TonB-dependent receptor, partial [Verrucomicrobiales bacterium]|nr:TonB-dependent receptor [Verrucomicrobiales bacterium]
MKKKQPILPQPGLHAVALVAGLGLPAAALAQQANTNQTTVLPDIRVTESQGATPFKPDVEGAVVYAGKKVSVGDLEIQPDNINNDYRRAFSQLPGLLVSEMSIPSHLNLGYRGIGDPHESEFLMTLKDGMPIGSDLFGYPTTYYTPPLQSIERVELIRGGSALLYGPQPGPKLNFVSAQPPADRRFTVTTENAVGSHGLFSTYNQISGTLDDFGYLAGFHHRQADGFRDNGDYSVFNGDLQLSLQNGERSRWSFGLYAYDSESGEAGRLSLAQVQANPDQT